MKSYDEKQAEFWSGGGGMPLPVCTRREPAPDRRFPLMAVAVLLTAVMIMATVLVWTPGCEDADAGPTVLGGIQYEVQNGVLTISVPEMACEGYKRGSWPSESEWYNVNWTGFDALRIVGNVDSPDKSTSYLFSAFGDKGVSTLDLRDWKLSDTSDVNLEIKPYAFANVGYEGRLILPDIEGSLYAYYGSFMYKLIKIAEDGQIETILGDTYDYMMWSLDGYKGREFVYDPANKAFLLKDRTEEFTVTFDPDGGQWSDGTSGLKSESCESGTEFDLSMITPTKVSYTLSGWLGDDGIQYKPGDKPEIYGNSTFKAVWEKTTEEFTVTFDPNGGAWSGSSEPVEYQCASGETVELAAVDPPTRESYTFDGWFFSGKTYSVGENVTVDSDMTFTAQWNAEGGSDPITPVVPAPIFPGDEQEPIEVVTDDGKDGSKDNEITVLIIGIVVAIIAILAVMSISRKS